MPSAPAAAIPWWVTAFAAPMVTALLALAAAWVAIRFDRLKSVNQELIKKRICIYSDMVPKANDLLCFYLCIGRWKSLNPDQMLEHKRNLDHAIYVYGALFSSDLPLCHHRFMEACFATRRGVGRPAALRANRDRLKRQWGTDWQDPWDAAFVDPAEAVSRKELQTGYDALLNQFAIEIGARRALWMPS